MNSRKGIVIAALALMGLAGNVWAQQPNKVHAFTHADSLLGGHRPERDAFDARHYQISIQPDFQKQTVSGVVEGWFKVKPPFPDRIQIDLDTNLVLDSVEVLADGVEDRTERTFAEFITNYRQDGRAHFINLTHPSFTTEIRKKTTQLRVGMQYHGSPRKASRPPWDGGLVWRKDSLGRDWLTVACQGDGASLWWPCKDASWDEPDEGIKMNISYPRGMNVVGNGIRPWEGSIIWFDTSQKSQNFWVRNPINLYNVTMNVGHYASREHTIRLESGKTVPFTVSAMDYHIDSYDQYLHFEGDRVIRVFSKLFGDYPWTNDGYRLVETPYWGMEHQSCVAYGNKLKRNQYGFDFIVVHETGHEWWGNLLSAEDNADFWLHEGFCTYAEVLFLEEVKGKAEAELYFENYILKNLTGKGSLVGPRGVAYNGYDTEPYYRGAALLHLMRYSLGNDKLFRKTLRDILEAHRGKPATTESVLTVIQKSTGKDFGPLFRQYLGDKGSPTFQYQVSGKKLKYRLANAEKGLELPIIVKVDKNHVKVRATGEWHNVILKSAVQTKAVPTIVVEEPSYLLNSEEVRE